MAKKKKGASQWTGYSEEEKRQYDMQFENAEKKEDDGFYGKKHIQKRTLF